MLVKLQYEIIEYAMKEGEEHVFVLADNETFVQIVNTDVRFNGMDAKNYYTYSVLVSRPLPEIEPLSDSARGF